MIIHSVTVYNYSRACGIPDEETVIITGGTYSQNTVSVYTVDGWQQDLPPLNTGRFGHACSSYWSDGRRVKKVLYYKSIITTSYLGIYCDWGNGGSIKYYRL